MQPLLSILIPTYNYRIGIERILHSFKNLPKEKCEVLIYDNSPNEDTKEYIRQWIFKNPTINITYCLNNPLTGPAENWNKLLIDAKGKYCLLLHNGEFPENDNFFKQLITSVENTCPDFALLNCILYNSESLEAFYHLPIWIKKLVIKKFPKYLFQRNVIGPASTIVMKKELYAHFDENLKWLLDVDSYYRSLLNSRKIEFLKNLNIVSVVNKSTTLTSEIINEITAIEKNERIYLSKKYTNIVWNQHTNNLFHLIKLEKIIWKVFIKLYNFSKISLTINDRIDRPL